MKETAIALSVMVLGVFMIFMWPVAIIWSINALFDTNIPVTFRTWLATMILSAVLKADLRQKD